MNCHVGPCLVPGEAGVGHDHEDEEDADAYYGGYDDDDDDDDYVEGEVL